MLLLLLSLLLLSGEALEYVASGPGVVCPGDHMGMVWKLRAGTWKKEGGKTVAQIPDNLTDLEKERAIRALENRDEAKCCLSDDLSIDEGPARGWIDCDQTLQFHKTLEWSGGVEVVHSGSVSYCPGNGFGRETVGLFKKQGPVVTANINKGRAQDVDEATKAVRGKGGRCCLLTDESAETSVHGWVSCLPAEDTPATDSPTSSPDEIALPGPPNYCPGDHMGMMWSLSGGTFRVANGKTLIKLDPGLTAKQKRRALEGDECCLGEDLSIDEGPLRGWIHCAPDNFNPDVPPEARVAPVSPQQGEAKCDAWAQVIDRDPKGLNVRESPSSRSPVVTKVFQSNEVKVVDERNGWFKIVEVRDAEETGRPAGTAPFRPGWVFGKLLGVNSNEMPRKFKAGPSESSATVQEKFGNDLKLLSCKGSWLQVLDSETSKAGWLPIGHYCSSPVTTCA